MRVRENCLWRTLCVFGASHIHRCRDATGADVHESGATLSWTTSRQLLSTLQISLCRPVVRFPPNAAVMLADAGAPAVLAPVPAAVMLADAGALAVLALSPLAVMLALVAPPLRCAHPLPLPFFSPRHPHPLLHRMVGLLPRRVAVSPLLAALAALSPLLPVPAPPPPLRLRHWTRPARGPLPPPGDCDRAPPPGQRSPFVPPPLARRRP